jgi:hypothetical protein
MLVEACLQAYVAGIGVWDFVKVPTIIPWDASAIVDLHCFQCPQDILTVLPQF